MILSLLLRQPNHIKKEKWFNRKMKKKEYLTVTKMRKKNIIYSLLLLLTLILVSCEGQVGYNGVVLDSITRKELSGVKVVMDSYYQRIEILTYSTGYFATEYLYSYGIINRDPSFTLTFTKEGYDTLTIDENYYSAPGTEFIDKSTMDTMIVKMSPFIEMLP